MSNKRKTNSQYLFANKDKTPQRNRLLHLMNRFQGRHGINLSKLDIDDMFSQIDTGNAELINRFGKTTRIYKVKCRNKDIVIVCKGKGDTRYFVTTYKLEQKHLDILEQKRKHAEEVRGHIVVEEEDYRIENKPAKIIASLILIFIVLVLTFSIIAIIL